jgi:hypothetical protein
MNTTNIEQYYNQARHWPQPKLDRYLLGRSTGSDAPLVLAITLAKISRMINSQYKQERKNVLDDPLDLLEYLVQESITCSDLDKEITVHILFSIAEQYLDECEQALEKPQEKPFQAILRASAAICQMYKSHGLNVATAVRAFEKITHTQLTWDDVAAFGKGESPKLGVNFKVGQKLSCKIRSQVMNGYATVIMSKETVAGILKSDKKLVIGTWVDAYFISVEKNRAWLSLTPPTQKSSQD